MKKIYIPQGGGRDFWLRIPMNNESAGRHLCMDDVDENEMHVWLESGYGGCWTLVWEKDGSQRDGIAAKVPASQLGYGTYSVVMAGKFVNGDYFRTKRQLFIRLVDREDQADAEPTMYNEEQAYWAGPAVLSEMLSRDGLNTYELWILQGNEGTMEQFLAFHGFTLNDYMVHWNHLSVDVQTKIQRGEEKGIEVMGDYSATTTYDVNDLVFDPTTNSSYISKHASNTGNALTDTDHWMKTMDGTDVLRAIEDADDATDAANTAAATAESAAAGAVTTITEALTGYFTCGASTNKGGLQTKVVDNDHDYIKPSYGGAMKIRMYQVNTYVPTTGNPVKLKIGNETAAELLYNREPVTPDNSWEENEVISVYYDGSVYQASNAQGGGGKAEKIKYDNSQSGLASKNVQGALDEVAEKEMEDILLFTFHEDLPANETTFYQYILHLEEGVKYRFVLEFETEPTANIVNALSTSPSSTTGRIILHTTKAGENPSEFCYIADSDAYQYLYWYSVAAHSFTMKIYKICEKMELAEGEIGDLGRECSIQQGAEIREASGYSWNGSTGVIGTTETIRAHMRIDAIGCRQISVTIPENYYAGFFYVDENNIMKGVVDSEWNSGTVTFDVNGVYDIMCNIKYGTEGTTTITRAMLQGVEWTISRIYDSFSPAAPYFDVIQATGGAMDLSDKIKIGNVSGNTPQTTTKIRAYYKLVNAPKGIIRASVNDGYYVTIMGYNGEVSTALASGWMQEQTAINNGYDTIWFSFKYGNNADFTPAIAKAAGFMFEFEPFPDSSSVMAYNSDNHTKMASLCRRHHSWPGHGYYHTYKYFTFAQITDTHALNMTVKRAVEYLNECKDIDMLLHTGDIQRKSFNDETAVSANTISEFMTYLKMAEKPFLLSLGNHDQNGANGSAITLSKIYDRFMQPMVDKGWLTENVNIDTENNATWYYKDFDKYGIRVISLNSFDPLYDGYYTSKGMDDNYLKFSQSQITWLVNTLQDVPEGYHVVVAVHTPYDSVEGDYPTIINSDWSSTAKNNAGTHGSGQPTHLSGNPMLDVLAAYKEKTTVTGTYSYDESAVQTALGSITVDADFTNAEGVLAFMAIGHNHDDWVGEFQSKANIKCVCMAGSMLTEPDSDLGRGQNEGLLTEYSEPIPQMESKLNGKEQDAINVYIVRTDLRKVYIIRMGADFTTDARDRVLTSFEY